MSTTEEQAVSTPPTPPDEPGEGAPDGGDGGWWSSSPTWAKAVVAGGVALVLFMLGGVVGGLVERGSGPTTAPSAGAVDVGYLQDMVVHHRQAVQMAVAERTRTADPLLAQMAFDMESSQTSQVGTMEGWLWLWDQPSTPPDGMHMGWMGMPMTTMPGMATEAELAELRALRGVALDVRFLQLMLRHHEGGFPMLAAAAEQAEVPAVRSMAQTMLDTQESEAGQMRVMLAQRGAAPLPTPEHAMPGDHAGTDHAGHGG